MPTHNDEVILCRCEGITLGQVRAAVQQLQPTSLRELKLVTRLGMGMCQGRVCRPIIQSVGQAMFQDRSETRLAYQIPTRPVSFGDFVKADDDYE